MLNTIKKFIKDEEGATAVEYGLIVAAIAAVIILVVTQLGTSVRDSFQDVATGIDNAGGTP